MNTSTETKQVPLFLTGQALRSLRDSGYSRATALGELVDNSIEANANDIQVWMEDETSTRGKKRIHRIIVVDDGDGMDQNVLHHALQIGFSTRYMRNDTIGKYGVGAKLAALNFAKRVDIWSRSKNSPDWLHVYFSVDEVMSKEQNGVSPTLPLPDRMLVPADMVQYLPKGSGTLVVWSEVDRLEEGKRAQDSNGVRIETEKELSRIFRHFINGGIRLSVNGRELLAHDPLFLMQNTWADYVLAKNHRKLVEESNGELTEVRSHFPARIIHRDTHTVGSSVIHLTVTLYPPEVIRERGKGGDKLAEQLRVPDNQGAISIVRLNREINYGLVPRMFPRGVDEPDRFIGIEIAFSPELDDYFGVRNVKRGVEPFDDVRTLVRQQLQKHIAEARALLDDIWGKASQKSRKARGIHDPIIQAAKEANRVLPKSRSTDGTDEQDANRILQELAEDVVGNDKGAQDEYVKNVRDLPFVVESVDFPGTLFMELLHIDGQVIIRLNTRHRFYRELWEPIQSIAQSPEGSVTGGEAVRTARRTIEALTLLLIAYGKAESMNEHPRDSYGDLRMYWGQFLDSLLSKIKGVI